MAHSQSPSAPRPGFTVLQVIPDLGTGGAEQTTLDVAAAIVRAVLGLGRGHRGSLG